MKILLISLSLFLAGCSCSVSSSSSNSNTPTKFDLATCYIYKPFMENEIIVRIKRIGKYSIQVERRDTSPDTIEEKDYKKLRPTDCFDYFKD